MCGLPFSRDPLQQIKDKGVSQEVWGIKNHDSTKGAAFLKQRSQSYKMNVPVTRQNHFYNFSFALLEFGSLFKVPQKFV